MSKRTRASSSKERKDEPASPVQPKKLVIHALEKPTFTTATCSELHSLMGEDLIDLNADYQRESVWSDKKQESLIDSIFQNLFIPPVLFAVDMEADGTETRICMDGKQRLTSIRRFMDSEIAYVDKLTGDRWYLPSGEKEIDEKRYIMEIRYVRLFKSKTLAVTEYHRISDLDQRDIFARVQLGEPLKAGEKLQASSDNYSKWLKELAREHVSTSVTSVVKNGLHDRVATLDRGNDYILVAATALVILEDMEGNSPKYHTTAAIHKQFTERKDQQPDDEFKEAVNHALSKLLSLSILKEKEGSGSDDEEEEEGSDEEVVKAVAKKPKTPRAGSRAAKLAKLAPVPECFKSVSVMELCLWAYFIYKNDWDDDEDYLDAFSRMRNTMREETKDKALRPSQKNFSTILTLVKALSTRTKTPVKRSRTSQPEETQSSARSGRATASQTYQEEGSARPAKRLRQQPPPVRSTPLDEDELTAL